MEKTCVVITTINKPSKAVEQFSKIPGISLIVVGDKKTPDNWTSQNVAYLSLLDQQKTTFGQKLPVNHYARKMYGYIYAFRNGADIIIDSDDDNIPQDNWIFPKFDGIYEVTNNNLGYVNIYKQFTRSKIWPRGYPLSLILEKDKLSFSNTRYCEVGIWQGLANGDTDVDAIYRLTLNKSIQFRERNPFVLGEGTISPINSQNTAFRKSVFPLLYLPSYVSFRYTDILRGLVAQSILWKFGLRLGIQEATVYQDRNVHNFMNDFNDEIPVYLNSTKIVPIVQKSIQQAKDINEALLLAYRALISEKITENKELKLLNAWIGEFTN